VNAHQEPMTHHPCQNRKSCPKAARDCWHVKRLAKHQCLLPLCRRQAGMPNVVWVKTRAREQGASSLQGNAMVDKRFYPQRGIKEMMRSGVPLLLVRSLRCYVVCSSSSYKYRVGEGLLHQKFTLHQQTSRFRTTYSVDVTNGSERLFS